MVPFNYLPPEEKKVRPRNVLAGLAVAATVIGILLGLHGVREAHVRDRVATEARLRALESDLHVAKGRAPDFEQRLKTLEDALKNEQAAVAQLKHGLDLLAFVGREVSIIGQLQGSKSGAFLSSKDRHSGIKMDVSDPAERRLHDALITRYLGKNIKATGVLRFMPVSRASAAGTAFMGYFYLPTAECTFEEVGEATPAIEEKLPE